MLSILIMAGILDPAIFFTKELKSSQLYFLIPILRRHFFSKMTLIIHDLILSMVFDKMVDHFTMRNNDRPVWILILSLLNVLWTRNPEWSTI